MTLRTVHRAWVLALLVLPMAAWVLWQAQRTFRADWTSWAAREQLALWVAGTGKPRSDAQFDEVQAAIARAAAIQPDSPALQERLGDVRFAAALQHWADVPVRQQHLRAAQLQYQAALALRPGEPQTWAMLSTCLQGLGAPPAEVHAAWAKAQALGPYEEHVVPLLLRVVLADWPGASQPMQDWAKALFDNGNEATRRSINAIAVRYGLKFNPDTPAKP